MKTTCPRCNGSGQAELSVKLEQTLRKIGKRRVTADDVKDLDETRGAASNRLDALYDIGLVGKSREHRGEPWHYFRTQRITNPPNDR